MDDTDPPHITKSELRYVSSMVAIRARAERLLAQGICIKCGKEPAVPGPRGGTARYCPACYERQRESQRKYNRTKRMKGA